MAQISSEIRTAIAAEELLSAVPAALEPVLVVPIGAEVPDWLSRVSARAEAAGGRVIVRLEAPADLGAEARAGWEIGVLTVVLGSGITNIEGADPRRRRRVEAVLAALASAAPTEVVP